MHIENAQQMKPTGNRGRGKRTDDRKTPYKGKKTEKSSDDRKKSYKSDDAGKKGGFRKKGFNDGPQFRKRKGDPLPNFSEEIRLNKFIANAGICSRREADVLIQTGVVEVNGKMITELGYKVKPGDEVKYDGAVIRSEKKQYVLLNKPKDFITSMDDPMGRKTVMQLVRMACKERIYPVGRLDRNTTGVLLFTNDGDLAKKLTHPRHEVRKIYHVELNKTITKEDLQKLLEGVQLDDESWVKADKAELLKEGKGREVGLELHSGKNRVVRRMFEAIGYEVKKLDRVEFAGLTKKELPRGKWRHLTEKEIGFLRMK